MASVGPRLLYGERACEHRDPGRCEECCRWIARADRVSESTEFSLAATLAPERQGTGTRRRVLVRTNSRTLAAAGVTDDGRGLRVVSATRVASHLSRALAIHVVPLARSLSLSPTNPSYIRTQRRLYAR